MEAYQPVESLGIGQPEIEQDRIDVAPVGLELGHSGSQAIGGEDTARHPRIMLTFLERDFCNASVAGVLVDKQNRHRATSC